MLFAKKIGLREMKKVMLYWAGIVMIGVLKCEKDAGRELAEGKLMKVMTGALECEKAGGVRACRGKVEENDDRCSGM